MKVAVFSMHAFEEEYLWEANQGQHQLIPIRNRLDAQSAILAQNCLAVSLFSSDDTSAEVLDILREQGIRYIALRSAGLKHATRETAVYLVSLDRLLAG